MERHWHLIYTPKGLEQLKMESVEYTDYVSASAELGKGGRHWHVYIKSSCDESTIRDKLKLIQKIPKGQRGKQNLHYSLREVLPTNPEYPGEDLQKFTLGYTLKNQNPDSFQEQDHFHEGYTVAELKEAYDYYQETTNRRYKPPVVNTMEVLEKIMEQPDGIQGEWCDFTTYFEEELKKRTLHNEQAIPVDFIKSHCRKFWRDRSNGLLPQASKYRRFLASIIDKYRARINLEQRMIIMKECGY